MDHPTPLLDIIRQTLHENAAPGAESLQAIHESAVSAARMRRRNRILMRYLRSGLAACLVILLGVHLRTRSQTEEAPVLSAAESAMELLLLDECGLEFDEGLASADKLLLFQEYPGYL